MKAAVFDIDGTLIDSIEFWKNLGKNYLISQGISPRDDLNKAMETLTVMEGVSYMKEEYMIGKSELKIKEELDELLFLYYKDSAKLKPYVIEVINTLMTKNIRLAIASVIDEKLIFLLLDRYGICDFFDFIQTSENTSLSKGNEDFFRLLAERLNIKPDEIFLFEDSLHCMEAAKIAGLNIVAVGDDYAKKDLERIIEISDIYLKDFSKLLKILN